jgi:hypothetical protein
VATEKDNENLVTKEVEAWKGFEYALRKPNSTLFKQMLNECLENEEYAEAFKTKGSQYSAESLFMALIFQQQKMISKLIESLESSQNKEMQDSKNSRSAIPT